MPMPVRAKPWTIADLDWLPDDGNGYEVVRGDLFVTPAPDPQHEYLATTLARLLEPYVRSRRLGQVSRPRAAVQLEASQVEEFFRDALSS